MMTPEMRLYQTATENNIAESIFLYLPQQTMTLSEEKLRRVIQKMTNPKIDAASQEFRYVVMDFPHVDGAPTIDLSCAQESSLS